MPPLPAAAAANAANAADAAGAADAAADAAAEVRRRRGRRGRDATRRRLDLGGAAAVLRLRVARHAPRSGVGVGLGLGYGQRTPALTLNVAPALPPYPLRPHLYP